jgi:ribosomal protein S18 acetylase RimI-like enzyme
VSFAVEIGVSEVEGENTMIIIKNATALDKDCAIDAVVRAFSADPSARWVYRDERQYWANFPIFVKAFAGPAFDHGSADYVVGCSAAALWLPPGTHGDEKALSELLRCSVGESDQKDVFAMFEEMDNCHPAEPHWYLPMIGVAPAEQGRGYGSALLKHGLERCDADDRVAYLEATTPQSVQLYERHGFERLGTIQVGSSPPLFPMLRRPRCFALG